MVVSQPKTYYDFLGLPPQATPDQIQQRYRELARKYHPDVAQDIVQAQKMFMQLTTAYETLRDPKRRAEYDRSLPHLRAFAPPTAPPIGQRPAAPAPPRAPAAPSRTAPASQRTPPRSPLASRSMQRLLSEAEGDALAQEGAIEEAIAAYQRALGRNPNPPLEAKIARLQAELAARNNPSEDYADGSNDVNSTEEEDKQPFWRRLFRRDALC